MAVDVSQETQAIRTAVMAKDVRDSIANGIDAVATEVNTYEATLSTDNDQFKEDIGTRQTNLENTFTQEIANQTIANPSNTETVAARTDNINNKTYDTLGKRLDAHSSQLAEKANQADLNTANSNIALKANQASLDTTNNNLASTNSNLSNLQTQVTSLASGSPKGTFATLSALQADTTANTTDGKKNIYVVAADGKWYYWNGTAWTAGGTYQSTGIADDSIEHSNMGITYLNAYVNTGGIDIDTTAKTITIRPNTLMSIANTDAFIAATTISYSSSSNPIYAKRLFYDIKNNSILWKEGNNIDYGSTDLAFLGILYNNKIIGATNLEKWTVNGISYGGYAKPTNGFGLLCGIDYLNFDFVNNVINIPVYSNILYDNTYYSINQSNSSISITNTTNGVQGLYFNITTKDIFVAHYTELNSKNVINNENVILIATFWVGGYNKVFAPFPVKINGQFDYELAIGSYNEKNNRLLLPNDMYFIDNISLPLYKSSILPTDDGDDKFKIALMNTTTESISGTPNIQYFYENIDLVASNLQNIFSINLKQKTDKNYNYRKNINKHVVTSTSNIGKTKTINCLGDSLTNRNTAERMRDFLSNYSVTASMVGTMTNGNVQGEGREGWTYTNFIGMNNNWGNNNTAITPQSSGATSDGNSNPFLKLATDTDKSNHPDWCFRNTGAKNEKSYTTDTDKTGNFYIFDYAYYLANHTINTPDIITIALSTNDIGLESANGVDAIATCRIALQVMITQIKAALPNVIIGVIPAPVWGTTDDADSKYENKVASWIENCITDIKTYQTTYNNLYVVPVWCHMNRDFIFPYDSDTNLSSINNSVKSHKSEILHFSEIGKKQYAQVTTAWVMNVI